MIYLIILIAGFFILLALGTPIAFALSIPSALVMMMSPDLSPIMLAQRIHSACDSFSMMAMPFFMASSPSALMTSAKACVAWVQQA